MTDPAAAQPKRLALLAAGREAVEGAVRYRIEAAGTSTSPAAQHSGALIQGVALESMGRMRDAAVLYDSPAHWEFANDFPSSQARRTTWVLTHAASALAAVGDTTRLSRLADSLKFLGERSGFRRDRHPAPPRTRPASRGARTGLPCDRGVQGRDLLPHRGVHAHQPGTGADLSQAQAAA